MNKVTTIEKIRRCFMGKKRKSLLLVVLIPILALALVVSQGISQQKPLIAKVCSLPYCHTAKPGELWGNLKTVSGKAEMIQIETGVLWTVKFDENTKVKN